MSALVALVALVGLASIAAGCGSSDGGPPLVRRVPFAASAAVLAGEDLVVPPHVVTLDAYGVIRVAEAPGKDVKVTALGRRDLPFTRTNLVELRRLQPQPERIVEEDVGGLDPGPAPSTFPGTAYPTRRGEVIGEVLERAGTASPFLVAAAPGARAEALVDVLAASGGLLAVSHQGTMRALRIEFGIHAPGRYGSIPWLEVRIGHAGLEIEGVPDAYEELPWSGGAVDAAAIARILGDLRTRRRVRGPEVDVLVSDTTSAQRLIDVLVRLDEAGVRAVVLGRAPLRGTEEAALRGQRIISVRMGQPQSVGDLDKSIIRDVVRSHLPELRACYEDALARDSSLTGTVMTQFFISPHGSVTASNANGVNPALAACFAKSIKSMPFPRPKGGGGVQVNFPFSLRS